MLNQYDTAIISAMKNYRFFIDVATITEEQIDYYETRNFFVYKKNGVYKISWLNPDIRLHHLKNYTPKIYNNFIAQDIYLRMTNGRDLTMISKRLLRNWLLENKTIEKLFLVPIKTIISLYGSVFVDIISNYNKTVYVTNGVPSLHEYYEGSFIFDSVPLTIFDDKYDIESNIFVNDTVILEANDVILKNNVEW